MAYEHAFKVFESYNQQVKVHRGQAVTVCTSTQSKLWIRSDVQRTKEGLSWRYLHCWVKHNGIAAYMGPTEEAVKCCLYA